MDISSYQHMNIRMSTRGKRPLRNLTPSDKVRAIQRIHNGETKASVSRDIGVPESTLRGWCKNEQKLRFMCRQLGMEQLPMDGLENPPEKRLKFESHISSQKFGNVPASYEDFGYNRLPLIGVEFAGNTINNNNNCSRIKKNDNSNAFFSEYMKKNSFPGADEVKLFNSSGHLPGLAALPVSADYSQIPMIQNLNLLSLLNPSLSAMSSSGFGFSAGNCSLDNDSGKVKVPLRISNSADEARDNAKNTSPALSMDNWGKDTSENMSNDNDSSSHGSSINISNKNNRINKLNLNDTNNNNMDVESHLLLASMAFSEMGAFPHSLFPAGISGLAQVQPAGVDAERSQAGQLEWWKMFNASLNFLAFAAAASALQSQVVGDSNIGNSANENIPKMEQISENILYKQLTKFNSLSSTSLMQSDVSNDSNFDSEPEDLSLRSTTSKLSSPANSRSQSPTKSTASSDTHSDTEQ